MSQSTDIPSSRKSTGPEKGGKTREEVKKRISEQGLTSVIPRRGERGKDGKAGKGDRRHKGERAQGRGGMGERRHKAREARGRGGTRRRGMRERKQE